MPQRPEKRAGAFRTIREVADWLGVPTHVLRFWESKFDQVDPTKGAGGRRYYRPEDMLLLGGIKVLLHDQGQTIRGVAQKIKDEGVEAVASLSPALDDEEAVAPRTRKVIRKEPAQPDAAAGLPPAMAGEGLPGEEGETGAPEMDAEGDVDAAEAAMDSEPDQTPAPLEDVPVDADGSLDPKELLEAGPVGPEDVPDPDLSEAVTLDEVTEADALDLPEPDVPADPDLAEPDLPEAEQHLAEDGDMAELALGAPETELSDGSDLASEDINPEPAEDPQPVFDLGATAEDDAADDTPSEADAPAAEVQAIAEHAVEAGEQGDSAPDDPDIIPLDGEPISDAPLERPEDATPAPAADPAEAALPDPDPEPKPADPSDGPAARDHAPSAEALALVRASRGTSDRLRLRRLSRRLAALADQIDEDLSA